MVSLVLIAAFLVVVGIFYGVLWALLGLAFLLFSIHSYYFPTVYELTEETITIRGVFGRQTRRLKEFRRVLPGKNGILLSPFLRRTFLNNFRGVFLLTPSDRAEIVALLRRRIEPTENGDTPGLGNT